MANDELVDTTAAIDRFLAHGGLSEATQRAYGSDLRSFAVWLDARGQTLDDVDARALSDVPRLQLPASHWSDFKGGPYDPGEEVFTSVPGEQLRAMGRRLCAAPADFHVHPKVAQGLALRRDMAEGARPVDWGMAEALAFGSLLEEGIGDWVHQDDPAGRSAALAGRAERAGEHARHR